MATAKNQPPQQQPTAAEAPTLPATPKAISESELANELRREFLTAQGFHDYGYPTESAAAAWRAVAVRAISSLRGMKA